MYKHEKSEVLKHLGLSALTLCLSFNLLTIAIHKEVISMLTDMLHCYIGSGAQWCTKKITSKSMLKAIETINSVLTNQHNVGDGIVRTINTIQQLYA